MKQLMLFALMPFFSFCGYEKFVTMDIAPKTIATYICENGNHYGYKKTFDSHISGIDKDEAADVVCLLGVNVLQSLYSLRIFSVTSENICSRCGVKVRIDPKVTLWSCKCDQVNGYSQDQLATLFLNWEIEYRSKYNSVK